VCIKNLAAFKTPLCLRTLSTTCRLLVEHHTGEVPQEIEELIQLPGVAPATATMVLYYAYGIEAGVTVDTHVKRLSERLGLTGQTDIDRIEKDLMQLLPQHEWGNCFVNLTYHGRSVFQAKEPTCACCSVADLCPSAQ
jgi:endonuclease-3